MLISGASIKVRIHGYQIAIALRTEHMTRYSDISVSNPRENLKIGI